MKSPRRTTLRVLNRAVRAGIAGSILAAGFVGAVIGLPLPGPTDPVEANAAALPAELESALESLGAEVRPETAEPLGSLPGGETLLTVAARVGPPCVVLSIPGDEPESGVAMSCGGNGSARSQPSEFWLDNGTGTVRFWAYLPKGTARSGRSPHALGKRGSGAGIPKVKGASVRPAVGGGFVASVSVDSSAERIVFRGDSSEAAFDLPPTFVRPAIP